jgi:hypothetical protein
MVQVTCQDIANLSEIEKYLLLLIRNTSGIKLSALFAHLHYPTSFLKKIIDLLVNKCLITIDPISNAVVLTDTLDSNEFDESTSFSRFNSNKPLKISCPPKYYHRMMKVLEYLYQHSLDLYMLNYNMDAIKNIREIFAILKNDFISNFHDLLSDLDAEFFSIFERNPRYFNEDNAGLLIDFSLNIIYKINYCIRTIVEQTKNATSTVTKYKEFYANQQPMIDELVVFLEGFRSKPWKQSVPDAREADVISAYFILYFHKKIGPLVYFETNNHLGDDFKSQVKKLMDVVNPEPFLYTIQSTTTWSCQFELDSPLARGNKEYLQLTIVLSKPETSGISIIKHVVSELINNIRQTKDVYKIFYIDDNITGEEFKANHELAIRLKNDFLGNFRVLNDYICLKDN